MAKEYYIRHMQAGRLHKWVKYSRVLPTDSPRVRAARREKTAAAQKFINCKNQAERLELILYANFDTKGAATPCFLTFTYDDEHLPETKGDSKGNIINFLSRRKRDATRMGAAFPYVYTTEGFPLSFCPSATPVNGKEWEIRPWKDTEKWDRLANQADSEENEASSEDQPRLHHHAVMLLKKSDYDIIRSSWPYGHVYISQIKTNDPESFHRIALYMTKDSRAGLTGNGERCYTPSLGLVKPKIEGHWCDSGEDIAMPFGVISLTDYTDRDCYSDAYVHALSYLEPRQQQKPSEYKRKKKSNRRFRI